jgi:hypothetical protein
LFHQLARAHRLLSTLRAVAALRPAITDNSMPRLALSDHLPKLREMKLLWATLLHLVVVGVLGAGILLLMQGKPALLIGGTVVYFALLGKVGCASH